MPSGDVLCGSSDDATDVAVAVDNRSIGAEVGDGSGVEGLGGDGDVLIVEDGGEGGGTIVGPGEHVADGDDHIFGGAPFLQVVASVLDNGEVSVHSFAIGEFGNIAGGAAHEGVVDGHSDGIGIGGEVGLEVNILGDGDDARSHGGGVVVLPAVEGVVLVHVDDDGGGGAIGEVGTGAGEGGGASGNGGGGDGVDHILIDGLDCHVGIGHGELIASVGAAIHAVDLPVLEALACDGGGSEGEGGTVAQGGAGLVAVGGVGEGQVMLGTFDDGMNLDVAGDVDGVGEDDVVVGGILPTGDHVHAGVGVGVLRLSDGSIVGRGDGAGRGDGDTVGGVGVSNGDVDRDGSEAGGPCVLVAGVGEVEGVGDNSHVAVVSRLVPVLESVAFVRRGGQAEGLAEGHALRGGADGAFGIVCRHSVDGVLDTFVEGCEFDSLGDGEGVAGVGADGAAANLPTGEGVGVGVDFSSGDGGVGIVVVVGVAGEGEFAGIAVIGEADGILHGGVLGSEVDVGGVPDLHLAGVVGHAVAPLGEGVVGAVVGADAEHGAIVELLGACVVGPLAGLGVDLIGEGTVGAGGHGEGDGELGVVEVGGVGGVAIDGDGAGGIFVAVVPVREGIDGGVGRSGSDGLRGAPAIGAATSDGAGDIVVAHDGDGMVLRGVVDGENGIGADGMDGVVAPLDERAVLVARLDGAAVDLIDPGVAGIMGRLGSNGNSNIGVGCIRHVDGRGVGAAADLEVGIVVGSGGDGEGVGGTDEGDGEGSVLGDVEVEQTVLLVIAAEVGVGVVGHVPHGVVEDVVGVAGGFDDDVRAVGVGAQQRVVVAIGDGAVDGRGDGERRGRRGELDAQGGQCLVSLEDPQLVGAYGLDVGTVDASTGEVPRSGVELIASVGHSADNVVVDILVGDDGHSATDRVVDGRCRHGGIRQHWQQHECHQCKSLYNLFHCFLLLIS